MFLRFVVEQEILTSLCSAKGVMPLTIAIANILHTRCLTYSLFCHIIYELKSKLADVCFLDRTECKFWAIFVPEAYKMPQL